jgi:anti-anti-sigma factor
MDTVTGSGPVLGLSARSERGCAVVALSGALDITCAPALREQLLALLCPGTGPLIIDLSRVSYADACGLAVLVGTGRRAGLLSGFLRLAAPAPAVARVLRVTGLHRQLDVFPTVQAAIASPGRGQRRPDAKADAYMNTAASTVHTEPAPGKPGGPGAPPTPRRSQLPPAVFAAFSTPASRPLVIRTGRARSPRRAAGR